MARLRRGEADTVEEEAGVRRENRSRGERR